MASVDEVKVKRKRKPAKAPPVRKDGLCYMCRGVRPEAAVKDGDPFDTVGCARKFWGTELPVTGSTSGPVRGG